MKGQTMSILEQLKEIEHFSESEKQIIHYLLNAPETILDFSVKDLAKVCYTSPSTVTRLANKLNNNKGFTHFKATFFSEITNANHLGDEHIDITSNETAYSIMNKVAALEYDAIEKTKQSMNYEVLSKISYLLNSSKQIEFFGFDNNIHLVTSSLHRMMSLGKQVIIHESTNAQFYQALTSTKDSVALVISRTGENRKLVELMSILKERKVPVIALTTNRNSSVGKTCDYYIEILNDQNLEIVGNILFDTSLQYVLNVICGILLAKNYKSNHEILNSYSKYFKHIY
jgi:DNA-binding MurR/RpiR family transcriptional regulator